MTWIPPNTITGDAATGSRYLRREYINEEFWNEVKKGNLYGICRVKMFFLLLFFLFICFFMIIG